MSQQHATLTLTLKATATIVALSFVNAPGVTAAAARNAVGVARTSGAAGDLVPVDVLGTATVTAGGVIANGDRVQVGAAGSAVTLAAGKPVGVALEPATAAGQIIEVLLIPN